MNLKTINEYSKLIDQGKIVIFPTETVYGMGADACSDDACSLIYKLKGRPQNNPLIIHCADIKTVQNIGYFNDFALFIAQKFWPGPLSIVLPLKGKCNQAAINISKVALCDLETVCVRIPNNEIALEFINSTKNKVVAAPSANISNYVSPTRFEHVDGVFNSEKVHVIKGEGCSFGLESTILDLVAFNIDCMHDFEDHKKYLESKILRRGSITSDSLIAALAEYLKLKQISVGDKKNQYKDLSKADLDAKPIDSGIDIKIKSPGLQKKHYSTRTRLMIDQDGSECNEQRIHIAFGSEREIKSLYQFNLSEKSSLEEAAYNLYDILRKADILAIKQGINLITVSRIPNFGLGLAINEKLQKAQHG